jgi:hypothetical protein
MFNHVKPPFYGVCARLNPVWLWSYSVRYVTLEGRFMQDDIQEPCVAGSAHLSASKATHFDS